MAKLQNKAIRIINNVPIRDHVAPHYVGLGLIKLPDIIKLSTCQLFHDHIVDKKCSNFALSFVSEIHDYATRSTYLQHLNPSPFRINIRKLFPTITGCYYWNDIAISIRKYFISIILFDESFQTQRYSRNPDEREIIFRIIKIRFNIQVSSTQRAQCIGYITHTNLPISSL